jgi:hypothetical protein
MRHNICKGRNTTHGLREKVAHGEHCYPLVRDLGHQVIVGAAPVAHCAPGLAPTLTVVDIETSFRP